MSADELRRLHAMNAKLVDALEGIETSTYEPATAKLARAALDAALAEPEKERAETGIPARGEIEVSTGKSYREHITDGSPCWCNPELNYRDPDTGAEVWVHRREQ